MGTYQPTPFHGEATIKVFKYIIMCKLSTIVIPNIQIVQILAEYLAKKHHMYYRLCYLYCPWREKTQFERDAINMNSLANAVTSMFLDMRNTWFVSFNITMSATNLQDYLHWVCSILSQITWHVNLHIPI